MLVYYTYDILCLIYCYPQKMQEKCKMKLSSGGENYV